MPALLTIPVHDEILGGTRLDSYVLNSIDECAAIAIERKAHDEHICVFTTRTATAAHVADQLTQAGLRVGIFTTQLDHVDALTVLNKADANQFDVLVATAYEGWRLHPTFTTILHIDTPQVSPQLARVMAQREARLHITATRHYPEANNPTIWPWAPVPVS